MLYVRTASGTFINAATIIQLSPQRAGSGGEITGWVAICDGGKAIAPAAYYAVPGRIEKVLDYMPASAQAVSEVAGEALKAALPPFDLADRQRRSLIGINVRCCGRAPLRRRVWPDGQRGSGK